MKNKSLISYRASKFLTILIIYLLMIYQKNFFQDVTFTYTNLMYVFQPFDSLRKEVIGPWLSDPADNVLPIAFSSIHKGIFTFWLSNIGIGMPQSMSIYLFFMNYFYLLPLEIAQIAISIVKVSIAFGTMYALLRRYGTRQVSALFSALVYSGSSTMVMWQGWPHSDVTMLAPLLFLVMDVLTEKFSINYLLLGVVVLFSMLVAGMPTYVAYFMYLLGIYVLFYGLKYHRKNYRVLSIYFGSFAVIVILATILSLPYTVDLLNTVGGNGYNASRKNLSANSLSLDYLRTLYFPYIRDGLSIHINEATLYTGIISVIILPLSIWTSRKQPKQAFYLGALIVVMFFMFSDLLYPIYKHLPLVNTSIRYRLIVLINFCLSINLGFTIEQVIIDQKNDVKIKISKIILSITGITTFILSYNRISKYVISDTLNDQLDLIRFISIISFGLLILIIIIDRKSLKKLFIGCLLLLTMWDISNFASYYTPGVRNDASVIPKATDSITFIQDNTENNEKIAPVGEWNFFASSNVYYGIRDVRGHNFVYTNNDIKTYYEAIDSNVYTTPTRVAFKEIENENLLKYMGVKYTLDTIDNFSDRVGSKGGVKPVAILENGDSFTQTFFATKDDLSNIRLFVGTYGQKFSDQDSLDFTLTDKQSNLEIRKLNISLKNQKDNAYIDFPFDTIQNSENREFLITVQSNVKTKKRIAFYGSNQQVYDGVLNNNLNTDNIVLLPIYLRSNQRLGNDGLVTTEFDDYSNQIQLTDTAFTFNSRKQLLNYMKANYEKTSVFFSENDAYPIVDNRQKLSDKEKISKYKENDDGTISFNVITNESRIVLVNEYYDSNWTAYIDGKKTNVYRGNGIFRAIKVSSGKHTVVLKYENKSMIRYLFITFGTFICLVVLWFYRKRVEAWINYY
ncbi:YfhO family protein [Enterococcus camelliae]|uniref:YfhO family protein n=1 Tax=Enterococcus camelliae TaxID=453959 RepID=A0ABW5TJ07_9ENTE